MRRAPGDCRPRRAHRSQTFEELAAIARRERAERNLAARAKAATLGTFKPLDRFDWNHPRTIQRELVEELMTLDFVAKGHNVPAEVSSANGPERRRPNGRSTCSCSSLSMEMR